MNDEMEDMEGNGHGLRYHPGICLEGLRKTIKPPVIWCFNQDLDQAPPKYKTRVITT